MNATKTNHPSTLNKGAIYLNNVGCALLEQGAFEDALETFRNAAHFQKALCLHCEAKSLPAAQALLNAIQQANDHLASPQHTQISLDKDS